MQYGVLHKPMAALVCSLWFAVACSPEHAALRDLRRGAAAGDAEALYQLGLLHAEDLERIYRWLSHATDHVTPPPDDKPLIWVFPDDEEAFGFFRAAAEQGHPEARYRLAGMVLEGRGTTPDPFEAYLAYARLEGEARGDLRERARRGRDAAGTRLSEYRRDEARGILRRESTPTR